MFADFIDDDLLLPSSDSFPLPSIIFPNPLDTSNNSGGNSLVLMQPKLESQTKMIPIAPRYDSNQSTSMTYTCSNCNLPIVERYFLHTQDRSSRVYYYHMQCLRCQCCDVVLADIASTFYTKDNALLCKSDYIKKYGSRPCSLCSQVIGTNEQIMRVSPNYVYHLSCFTCVKCHTPLVKGDRYVLFNGQPFCEKDNPLKSTTNIINTSITKRGTTSAKRGAKTARAVATQIQPTYVPPPQYHPTGHISLLNNHHHHTSTITHSLLSNNNATPSGDELY